MSSLKDDHSINLDIQQNREKYFDYSFHEMGLFDQPALWRAVMAHSGK